MFKRSLLITILAAGTLMGSSLPAQAQRRPGTLRYIPGDPIPYGYQPVLRRRKGLIIGGAAGFGGAYLFSAMLASSSTRDSQGYDDHEYTKKLYIPLVGPFFQ